ncbi:MAG: twin-arginine translocase subunit TatC [Armatimonadota bacterium]
MAVENEKKAELYEHLAELRTRLIRVIIYWVIGTLVAWFFYTDIFQLLTEPMKEVLEKTNTKFLITSLPEAFMIKMQVSLISGAIISLPFITIEMWGFVSPALTKEEKRPLIWIAPLSIILFIMGVVICYFIMPTAFNWFASQAPPDAELRPTVQASILFIVKMMLAFGIMFELPIILMALAKLGIVESKILKDNWRIAIVLIVILGAVATPSGDAFSMLMMAVPVIILYFLSIMLVRMIEKKSKRQN